MHTLDFNDFRDSFELITPAPSKSYAGFEAADIPASVWWSEATQCLIMRDQPSDACYAQVSNEGVTGLFDQCAAFVYINHYLIEQTANADPMGEELHRIARCFMGVYPFGQLSLDEWFAEQGQLSLDEWLAEHGQDISAKAHQTAQTIIERFFQ